MMKYKPNYEKIVFIFLFIFMVFLILPREIFTQVNTSGEISDKDITLAVSRQFKFQESINAQLIDIETINGVVKLSGTVDNLLANDQATDVARRVKGVRSVINDIEVKPVDVSDEKIKEQVLKALVHDRATEPLDVEVEVKDGVVTLTGVVESFAEIQLADEVARSIKGVKKVKSEIRIDYLKGRADEDIRKEIEKRMRASILLNSKKINIKVDEGHVFLSGVVGSAAEKNQAFRLAWVAGVKSVMNKNLKVDWKAREKLERTDKFIEKSDEEIKQAVIDAFVYDPRVNSRKIDVRVDKAVVTLSGELFSLEAKNAAEMDANNTIGVFRVKNHIKVRSEEELNDSLVVANIKDALLYDPVVYDEDIVVISIHGKVYLNGRVNSFYKKQHVEDVVSGQPGVIDVKNNLIVDYMWISKGDQSIKEDIKEEFFWSLFLDDEDIKVDVNRGNVTLSGVVKTRYQSQLAVKNAFEGGARSVTNNIAVFQQQKDEDAELGRFFDSPYFKYH